MPESKTPEPKTDPTNRWWVESSRKERSQPQPSSAEIAGSKFFRAGLGFSQEPARDRLTDNNLKIVKQAMPEQGQWTYVKMGEADPSFPEKERERITAEVALPPYARGVVVDCGRSIRLLVTGTPVGDRLLDLTLSGAPSFDCWIHDEWVREAVFKDANAAVRAFKRLLPDYLSPEAIILAEEISARA